MKHLVPALALSLAMSLAPPVQATPADESRQAPTPLENEAGEPATDQQSAWPVPFQPSQQVGADAKVSFPTDI